MKVDSHIRPLMLTSARYSLEQDLVALGGVVHESIEAIEFQCFSQVALDMSFSIHREKQRYGIRLTPGGHTSCL